MIEDFGTGYLPEYPDGSVFVPVRMDDAEPSTRKFLSHQFGMAGVVKQLIDHMMQQLIAQSVPPIQIARLTVLTNIAFVEKSHLSPGPLPASVPVQAAHQPAHQDDTTDILRRLNALENRLSAVETTLGRFLARLEPLRRLKRMFK
ncbi:MAG: hypothetical protein AB7F35_02905 [Acetobacteraceae bacterium]